MQDKYSRKEGYAKGNKFANKDGVFKLRGLGAPALKSKLDGNGNKQGAGAGSGSSWTIGDGDVSYRDAVLPPAQKRISRETRDAQLLAEIVKVRSSSSSLFLRKISSGDSSTPSSLTTLQRCCLRVIMENIDQRELQERLADAFETGYIHQRYLSSLLRRLLRASQDRELPFVLWQQLIHLQQNHATSSSSSFSSSSRVGLTYEGLVLDDTEELRNYNTPDHTALVDLHNTAFQASEIYKIRLTFSQNLTALKLDYLIRLTDDDITTLVRDAGSNTNQAFGRLEILTLRMCSLVTDKSAPKIAKLPALKLLDLRGTSCTSASKLILRQYTLPPFIAASKPEHLALFGSHDIDALYCAFLKVSRQGFHSGTSDERTACDHDPPRIVVTELSRLDQTKVSDPRIPTLRDRYTASDPTFGKVYTTIPISSSALRQDGMNESSRGAAFHSGPSMNVMTGALPISRVDVGWKRFGNTKKRKEMTGQRSELVSARKTAALGDDDSDLAPLSDEEDEDIKEDGLATSFSKISEPRSAFYGVPIPKQAVETDTSELPMKSDLMLVRFFSTKYAQQVNMPIHSDITQSNGIDMAEKPHPDATRAIDHEPIRVKKRIRLADQGITRMKERSEPVLLMPQQRGKHEKESPVSSQPLSSIGVNVNIKARSTAPASIVRKSTDKPPTNLNFTDILSRTKAWS